MPKQSISLGNPQGIEKIYLIELIKKHVIFNFRDSSHGEEHDLKQMVLRENSLC